jgi:hypothetical protein
MQHTEAASGKTVATELRDMLETLQAIERRAEHIKQFARAGMHVMENAELLDAPPGPKGDAIFILLSLLQAIEDDADQVQEESPWIALRDMLKERTTTAAN